MNRVEWITGIGRFAELRDDWNRIIGTDDGPFLAHEWFETWWNCFVPEGAARVCTLWEGDRMMAAFPLWSSGQDLMAMANYYTDVFRPIAVNERSMAEVIDQVFSSKFSSIEVFPLASTHPSTHLLKAASKRYSQHYCFQASERCPAIDVIGEFEDYRQLLGHRTRQTAGRKMRKFEREQNAAYRPLFQPENAQECMDQFLHLEALGWKGRGGTAINQDPQAEKFHRTIAKRFHKKGSLRMGEIRLDGRMVAGQMILVHGNRLWAIRSAYDEQYRLYGPGMTMLYSMIEAAFDSEFEAIELLGDADELKGRFSTSERRTMSLKSYRPGLISTPKYLFWEKAVPVLKPMNDRRKQRKKDRLKSAKIAV